MVEILQDAGKFEILTLENTLRHQVIYIEVAGRTCYQSEKTTATLESAAKFIKMLLKRGHFSVLEHGLITVRFSDCSRGMTHELVRHRLASFSQESTRYVDESNLRFVLPPGKERTSDIVMMANSIESFYRGLLDNGWKPEDARQFLPIGTVSQIVVSANFREWRHIFTLRTAMAAHWEIRSVMGRLLVRVQELVPGVFDDFENYGVDGRGIPYYKHVYGA